MAGIREKTLERGIRSSSPSNGHRWLALGGRAREMGAL
jgi:hypothetical protein